MLPFKSWAIRDTIASPILTTTLPPRGNGRPVCSNHRLPAQIDHLVQPFVAIIKLSLVDQEPGIHLPFRHCRQDFVERH